MSAPAEGAAEPGPRQDTAARPGQAEPWFVDGVTFDWLHPKGVFLWTTLYQALPDKDGALLELKQIGAATARINFDRAMEHVWADVLDALARQGKLRALLVHLGEKSAYGAYHTIWASIRTAPARSIAAGDIDPVVQRIVQRKTRSVWVVATGLIVAAGVCAFVAWFGRWTIPPITGAAAEIRAQPPGPLAAGGPMSGDFRCEERLSTCLEEKSTCVEEKGKFDRDSALCLQARDHLQVILMPPKGASPVPQAILIAIKQMHIFDEKPTAPDQDFTHR
jgi:hypothetical protein